MDNNNDHKGKKMDHSKMDHSKMNHSKMDHSKMEDAKSDDHSKMDHHKMDHSKMDHSKMNHGDHDHGSIPMGMAGHDHHKMMIADFKKRFWITLILTIPILFFSPMIQDFFGYSLLALIYAKIMPKGSGELGIVNIYNGNKKIPS